ncbi:MAG TPA: (d)CMP kinase, partial [Longimicrobiales bacterium]|nr:(d)CMP kinase [Longimicrobiales bacterium]
DVTEEIRSPEVDTHVSRTASIPAVRDWLLGQLRAAASAGDLVTDGRDMGTVVFPDADIKVFLTADPVARARRRLAQRGENDPSREQIEEEVRKLLDRDRQDSGRATAPLRQPEGAVILDTSALTLEQQVEVVADLIRARRFSGT